jgi:MYXO-CTERM domain-containing protein
MKRIVLLLALIAGPAVQAATYASNGNTGFGGVLSSLDITDDGTNITFALTAGASLNDAFVLYISNGATGSTSTALFTDTGDPLRKAISGFDGTDRSTVNMTAGFEITHALALDGGFAGLWATVDSGSHPFVATANGTPGGPNASPYNMTVAITDLGISPGDSFDFVGTYLNSGNAFRSDEAFGPGISPGSPGVPSTVTFTGSLSYTTTPEPSAAMLGAIGLLGLLRRRR